MPMQFEIRGLNRLNGFLRGLPTNLRNEISKESESFMLDIRKSAKLRAPKDTRELANSIRVFKESENTIVLNVGAPWGIFQEEGFRPHWIHTSMIIGSNKFSQIYGGKEGFIFVSKSKPFIRPALEHHLNKLAQRISKAKNRAIQGSRR